MRLVTGFIKAVEFVMVLVDQILCGEQEPPRARCEQRAHITYHRTRGVHR